MDKEKVDLYRFRRLVVTAQNADAVHAGEILHEALELWHGPPLTGVAGHWLTSRVGTCLEEERLSVLEEHAAVILEVGRLREAIVELTPLVADYPLRERSASLLMVALHRSGRRHLQRVAEGGDQRTSLAWPR
ncbi:BTAD domain-containing putative transcriptional regulator [Streptomyces sp. NPDC004629]|uniref:AfsR/SARP family transcriptional regulator n=1 Tax=Streptomyces sp. NPDC004629 TaxID=3364705 RepID=UPI003696871B